MDVKNDDNEIGNDEISFTIKHAEEETDEINLGAEKMAVVSIDDNEMAVNRNEIYSLHNSHRVGQHYYN